MKPSDNPGSQTGAQTGALQNDAAESNSVLRSVVQVLRLQPLPGVSQMDC